MRVTTQFRPDTGLADHVLVLEDDDYVSGGIKGRTLYIRLTPWHIEELHALLRKEVEQNDAEAEADSSENWLVRFLGDGSD